MRLIFINFCLLLALAAHASDEHLAKQKVDSLYNLAWEHRSKAPDSSLYFSNLQSELAAKIDYDLGLVNAYYVAGFAYDELRYFKMAASNYFKGLDIAKKHSGAAFKRKQIFLLQCLGVVYEKTFQYDHALKYSFEALKIAQETNNKTAESDLHFNIAVHYKRKGNLDLAIEFQKTCIKICDSIDYSLMEASAYNLLGTIYSDKDEYNLANECYQKAIKISDLNDILTNKMPLFINNLGENFLLLKDFDQAKAHFYKALAIGQKLNDTVNIKRSYNYLGDVYFQEKNYAEAISHYKKTIALGNDNVIDEELQRAYKKLSQAYEITGEYKLALASKSNYIAQSDKIVALKEELSAQNAQYRMKELEWQRKLMEKEVLLASAQKENLWSKIIIGAGLLLVLFCGRLIFIYYRKIARVKKEMESYTVEWFDF